MGEKKFKVHTIWFNPEKTDGEHTIKEGGQPLITTKSLEDAKFMKDLLNELYKENEQLKQENEKLKSKLEYAEEVLNNIGYDLVYDETENRWVVE